MGLFDKVLGKEDQGALTLAPEEAFAAVGVAAVAADGELADEELRQLYANLMTMKLFQRYDVNRLNGVLRKVAGLINKRGVDVVTQAAAKALDKDQRDTGFALAADLLLADGVVEAQEKAFLEKLQTNLGVDDALALKVVEVMVVKNRG